MILEWYESHLVAKLVGHSTSGMDHPYLVWMMSTAITQYSLLKQSKILYQQNSQHIYFLSAQKVQYSKSQVYLSDYYMYIVMFMQILLQRRTVTSTVLLEIFCMVTDLMMF